MSAGSHRAKQKRREKGSVQSWHESNGPFTSLRCPKPRARRWWPGCVSNKSERWLWSEQCAGRGRQTSQSTPLVLAFVSLLSPSASPPSDRRTTAVSGSSNDAEHRSTSAQTPLAPPNSTPFSSAPSPHNGKGKERERLWRLQVRAVASSYRTSAVARTCCYGQRGGVGGIRGR